MLFSVLAADAGAQNGFAPIEVEANAIAAFEIANPVTPFGELSFLGGLALRSPDDRFGAISGLDVTAEGQFVAVTDTGFWLTGSLVEEDGNLRGVEDVAMAPILDEDGETAIAKFSADAESVRYADGGETVLVAYEQQPRVSRFDAGDLAHALPDPLPLPSLPGVGGNRGLEAVAVAPANGPLQGAVVILAEGSRDGAGNLRGWVLDGPMAGTFAVRAYGSYAITDAAFLPNGDLFLLERLFSLSDGIGVRIRRLSADDIRPGATVDGPVILQDGNLFQIDNMEGIAVRRLPSGDVVITLVSDNNHSLLQRNLMLQFLWRETVPPPPAVRP